MKTWSWIAFLLLAGFGQNAFGATLIVTNTGDSGPGSLRAAVMTANSTAGADIITFNIQPAGPQTITLFSTGLSITSPLTLDGTTQPGFSGKPIIMLAGADGAGPGLSILTNNCSIRGLVISDFDGPGIILDGMATDNSIGGTDPGLGNRIERNALSGISVISGMNNAIRGNSIFANGALGIDLGDDGVTLNDNRDPDTGPNQRQNFPVLTAASISSNSISISGSMNSKISTVFQVDFFASQVCDELGSGEGQFYLGSRNITTAAAGTVSFNFALAVAAPGRYITATATDPQGNTSEFSPCMRASTTIPPLTLTVVNTNDAGPGSLRQAMIDVGDRVTFGTNTIKFSIPGAGFHTIFPTAALPAFLDPVVLDGYSQPGASPNILSNGFNAHLSIQLDGQRAEPGAVGLVFRGDVSVIRGVAITSFQGGGLQVLGSSNVIQGNLIGLDSGGILSGNGVGDDGSSLNPGILLVDSAGSTIGGASVAARNVISANGTDGIRITGAAARGNQVLGNFIGTDLSGLVGFGNVNWGINLDGVSSNIIGGTAVGAGNLISWNGSGVQIFGGVSNRVQGNLIGCDVTGTNALGNGFGISLVDASLNQIGGTNAAARNVIVANGQGGLMMAGASSSNTVQGNYVGIEPFSQRELGNGAFGIHLDLGDGNQIGGTTASAGNVIAFNNGNGIEMSDGQRNAILRNSIFSNGGLGIDLSNDGLTANDSGDTDAGANGLQNFPELSSAIIYTNRTIVRGALRSRPGIYTVQLFENASCDNSGAGEGQTFLTNLTVTVPAGGVINLNYTNASLFPAGHFVTATATDASNDTSEFSPCLKLVTFNSVDLAVLQEDSPDPVELSSNVTYTITVTNLGPTNATGVVLTDLLPAGLSFVTATSSQGSCSFAAGAVTCQLNSINQGAAAIITVRAQATALALVQSIASVTANQIDNSPENNTSSESTLLGVADLGVGIVDSPDPVLTGRLLTYAVTVTNRGPNPATGVVLNWLASPGTPSAEIFSAIVSQGTLNLLDGSAALGTIAVNGSALLTLKIVPLDTGTFELDTAVSSVAGDLDLLNNEAMAFTEVNPGSGVVQLASAEYTVNEGNSSVEMTLIRVGGDLGSIGVSYATSNGTAMAGSDFVNTTGTLTFGPGETSAIILVPILDDAISECNESLTLSLFGPTGFPVLVGRKEATVTLFDDDLPPGGTVTTVSAQAGNDAIAGNGLSSGPSVSADGRWVAFVSGASDLTPADANGVSDVFVRDLTNGTTRLVSMNILGNGGNAASDQPVLSADGQTLAFFSAASDLVTNNVGAVGNVFVRNLATDVTTLVSVGTNGANGGNSVSQTPVISSNGLIVAFTSAALDLVTLPNPTSSQGVYLRDLTARTTRLVSVNRFGTGPGNGSSYAPHVSANGRWVAFESEASDLVVGDTNGVADVFVRDTFNGVTSLAAIRSTGAGSGNGNSCCASLSGDGRYVAFYSEATDLVPGGSGTSGNIFVRDLVMGMTRLVSVSTNGLGGNGPCRNPVLSGNGHFVAFASDASDLVSHDVNGQSDVFVRDLVLGNLTLASVTCDGFGPGNAGSGMPALSEDGQIVAFLSLANNLAPGQFPAGRLQAFRRDLSAGTTELMSINHLGTGGGDDSTTAVLISGNGETGIMVSDADDLGADDENGSSDVFAWHASGYAATTDLAVFLLNPVPLVPFGGQREYTLIVSNLGPETATEVVLQSMVSEQTVIDNALVSQGSAQVDGSSVLVQFGSILPGEAASVVLTVTSANVSFVTSTSVAGAEKDNDLSNNLLEETLTCPSADVLVQQSFLPNPASLTGPIHFTLLISNRGPVQATGLRVLDTLPAGLGFISANSATGACTLNGQIVTCYLPALEPQESMAIDLFVQPTAPGIFLNLANVIAATCDPALDNNNSSISVPVNGVSRPPLSIQNAGDSFVLEWPPGTPPGFLLETTTTMMSSNSWMVITNAANPFVITNSPGERSRFYRLRMP